MIDDKTRWIILKLKCRPLIAGDFKGDQKGEEVIMIHFNSYQSTYSPYWDFIWFFKSRPIPTMFVKLTIFLPKDP
jgi:hypothetical protein